MRGAPLKDGRKQIARLGWRAQAKVRYQSPCFGEKTVLKFVLGACVVLRIILTMQGGYCHVDATPPMQAAGPADRA